MNFISYLCNRTLKRFQVVLPVFINNIVYKYWHFYNNILKTFTFLYHHISIYGQPNNTLQTELSRESYLSWRIFTKCVWKQHHLFIEVCTQQKAPSRDFPDCQRLRLYLPMQDSIPGERAKIPHTSWQKTNKQTNIKQKQYCNKFNKDFKNSPHQKKKKSLFKKETKEDKVKVKEAKCHYFPACSKLFPSL